MTVQEFYESNPLLWSDDFSYAQQARYAAALISLHTGGEYALEIGCGSGWMISELLRCGACGIEAVDLSPKMIELASRRFQRDARVHLSCMDFLALTESGFDAALAFDVYHHFPEPERFLQKAHELLRLDGRLTVAYPFEALQINRMNYGISPEISRRILPAREEAELWREWFAVDCICETEGLYLISGHSI